VAEHDVVDQEAEKAEELMAEVEEAPPEAEHSDNEADRERQREHFFAVVQGMQAALAESPSLDLTDSLAPGESAAIEMLFEAKSATDSDIGAGHVSALRRGGLLDRGLAALQPILALGRSGEIEEGRAAYGQIEQLVAAARREIASSGAVESIGFSPRSSDPLDENDNDDSNDNSGG
jgi:hypothetical protein